MIKNAAPSAPVMNRLRPLITHPPSTRLARRQRRRIRARSGSRLRHGEGGPALARDQWSQVALALVGRRDMVKQMDVSLVGRLRVDRDRTEERVAGRLQHAGSLGHVQSETAQIRRTLRRKEPGVTRMRLEPAAQVVAARGLDVAVMLVVDRDDHPSYEVPGRRDERVQEQHVAAFQGALDGAHAVPRASR